jgi:hypothetical protein
MCYPQAVSKCSRRTSCVDYLQFWQWISGPCLPGRSPRRPRCRTASLSCQPAALWPVSALAGAAAHPNLPRVATPLPRIPAAPLTNTGTCRDTVLGSATVRVQQGARRRGFGGSIVSQRHTGGRSARTLRRPWRVCEILPDDFGFAGFAYRNGPQATKVVRTLRAEMPTVHGPTSKVAVHAADIQSLRGP